MFTILVSSLQQTIEVFLKNFNAAAYSTFIVAIVLGLIVGGWATTLIARFPVMAEFKKEGKSYSDMGYIFPLGFCWSCYNKLPIWNQIPVMSYFFLRKKCHFCESKISVRYPLTEILTALAFLAYIIRWPDLTIAIAHFGFLFGLIVLAGIIFDEKELPLFPIQLLLVGGLLCSSFQLTEIKPQYSIQSAVLVYAVASIYRHVNLNKNEMWIDMPMSEAIVFLFSACGAWLGAEKAIIAMALGGLFQAIQVYCLPANKNANKFVFYAFILVGAIAQIIV